MRCFYVKFTFFLRRLSNRIKSTKISSEDYVAIMFTYDHSEYLAVKPFIKRYSCRKYEVNCLNIGQQKVLSDPTKANNVIARLPFSFQSSLQAQLEY